MSWNHDHLAPVETLLYRSDLIKVGTFVCDVAHPCFSVSEPLDNDVFVLPKRPVWIRRNEGEYRFVEPGAILMHRAGATLERRPTTSLPAGVVPEACRAASIRPGPLRKSY